MIESTDTPDDLLPTARDFEHPTFIHNNLAAYTRYIGLRIEGNHPLRALRLVFGDAYVKDNLGVERTYAIERTKFYRDEFSRRLEETKICDMWNPKLSVHRLKCIVMDTMAKESVVMSAIKELNVITNITIVDESGKTRAGRSLDDFYADEVAKDVEAKDQAPAPGETPPDAPQTTH